MTTYKETLRLLADFSTQTLQDRSEWQDIFKVMEQKNLQSKILYPATFSFRFDKEIKSFPDKENLGELSTTKIMNNLDSILKSRDISFPTKVHLVEAIVFPVVKYGCESLTVKKAEH